MKIYVDNLLQLNNNKYNVNTIQNRLTNLIVDSYSYLEVYTNEGIYLIDNKTIYSLDPQDGKPTLFTNYLDNVNILVDYSFFDKTLVTFVKGNEHCQKNITKYNYKLNPKSKISLVVEVDSNDGEKNLNNIYFYSKDVIDVKELFIKQEINEFLFLLN